MKEQADVDDTYLIIRTVKNDLETEKPADVDNDFVTVRT